MKVVFSPCFIKQFIEETLLCFALLGPWIDEVGVPSAPNKASTSDHRHFNEITAWH